MANFKRRLAARNRHFRPKLGVSVYRETIVIGRNFRFRNGYYRYRPKDAHYPKLSYLWKFSTLGYLPFPNNWVLGIQTGPFAACQAECLSNFYQRATLIYKSPIGPISEDRVSNEMSICRIYQIRPPHLSNTTTETDMNVQKHDAEVAWPAIFSAFQNVQKDVYEVAWPQNLMSFQISISLPVSFGSQKPTRSQIRSLSITFSWPFLHADL